MVGIAFAATEVNFLGDLVALGLVCELVVVDRTMLRRARNKSGMPWRLFIQCLQLDSF
jgi:hypothetical protein